MCSCEDGVMQRHNKAALIIVLAVVAAGSIYLWARGSHDRVYDGLLQVGFEKSDFYPDANCAASPYWYGGSATDSENLRVRWREMGSPPALRVKFRGDLTSLGLYGHLNKYPREIRSTTILEATASAVCQK